MGWRIVKQPNGLFARFSDVVDHFTNVNLTEDQVVESCLEHGCSRQEAEYKLDRAARDLKPFSIAEGNGLDRWNHCLGIIERVHGKLDMEETRKMRSKFAKQPKLSSVEMWKWLSEHVSTYASGRAYDGKNLSLKVSGLLRFTVTHGDSTVYSGFDMGTAIDAYNNLL